MEKCVDVFQELVLFTELKIFTGQSKRRPRGKGNVSLGIKTLASPMEAGTVGMGATGQTEAMGRADCGQGN